MLVSAAVLLYSLTVLPVSAQQVINTAVPFQRIAPDARSAGMGEVGAATAPDVYSMHWNAAKYIFLDERWGAGLNYTPWLRKLADDMGLSLATAYRKFGELQAVAFSIKFFSLGDFRFSDRMGNETMDYRPNEFSVDAAYIRRLSPNLSASVAFRYLQSAVGAYNFTEGERVHGTGFAADAALFFNKDIGWGKEGGSVAAGINLSNVGPGINYMTEVRPLPTTLRLGVTVLKNTDSRNSLALSLDVEQPLNLLTDRGQDEGGSNSYLESTRKMRMASGMELSMLDMFFLRTGVSYTPARWTNQRFFSAGFGLLFNGLGVDFAYLLPYEPYSPIANTVRIGVSIRK